MSNGLATAPADDGRALLSIIERAATSDEFDVNKMQQLMEMKRTWDADRAAEKFGTALSAFQAECPGVFKGRTADTGKYKYKYAGFEDVMAVAGPALHKQGLAVSFSTESNDRGIRVTCRIRLGTHAEDHTLDVPIPQMVCNDTQKYGAALSYAKRYALCAALNIVVTDEDSDAQGLGETITEEQRITLQENIDSHQVDVPRFMKYFHIERLADLPVARFDEAVGEVKRKPLR